MRQNHRLGAFLMFAALLALTACGGEGTVYRAPGSEYLLDIDKEGGFSLSRAGSPGGAKSAVSKGTLQSLTGGLLKITTGEGTSAVVTYGLEIPGYAIFMRPDQADPTLLPFLLKQKTCASDTRWNWVSWRSSTATDNAATAFFGVFSYLEGELSHLLRYDLATHTNQGMGAITLGSVCDSEKENGFAVGDTGNAWYFQSNGVLGKTTTTANKDLVLGLGQQQFLASHLTGTFTGIALRRVGATDTVQFPRFTATPTSGNSSIVGYPIQLPENTTDTSRVFEISLTSFNALLADGMATGTVTVTDASLTGGLSTSMRIACIGRLTLGSLNRPVLFCVSEGYTSGGTSTAGASSFQFILRGE